MTNPPQAMHDRGGATRDLSNRLLLEAQKLKASYEVAGDIGIRNRLAKLTLFVEESGSHPSAYNVM